MSSFEEVHGTVAQVVKVPGTRAGLIHDRFTARQYVEDDNMNVICLAARSAHAAVAWNLIMAFLAAGFEGSTQHLRRLGKVAALEGAAAG